MMKKVIINIKGTQGLDGELDTVELMTEGRLGFRDEGILLSYDEGEIIGEKGVKTLLRIKDDGTVILQRTGAMRTRLVVQQGSRNSCFYCTDAGEIVIGIFGESIDHNLTAAGGTLRMSYTIDSNLQLISRNVVEITVREVNNNVNTCS